MKVASGLTGRIKVEVVNPKRKSNLRTVRRFKNWLGTFVGRDRIVDETDWQRNLWLDQGLDKIASIPICDCFNVASKGTGTTPTVEDLTGTANTYSIPNGTTTLSRAAGTRDFSAADVGKLIKFATTPFAEFTIATYNSVTSVTTTVAATATVTTDKIVLYSIQQTNLTAPVGRTAIFSLGTGDNKTTTSTNQRTFQRTFIFPTEDTLVNTVASTNTYAQTGTTVTRTAGTRDFVSGDVGSTITFVTSNLTAVITVFTDATHVTVGVSQTNLDQPIVLTKKNPLIEDAITGTYSRSGTTVTRATGARDFTSNDVGKVIHFNTLGTECKITVYTSATVVTVDTSGTVAAQAIKMYGFTDYNEIGFSHTMETGPNLNIRVALASPVRAYVGTPLQPSDQIKVTYQCRLSVTPYVTATANLAGVISDPGNLMSANKNGSYVIESFATSTIGADGQTDISFPDLEPFYDGFGAFSENTDALVPLTGKIRALAVQYVTISDDPYIPGSFYKTFQAFFGLNDAIGSRWRSLMLYDPQSQNAIFTFLYLAPQIKDGNHTFQVAFQKTWNRDLS